jgi:hypothetical protein
VVGRFMHDELLWPLCRATVPRSFRCDLEVATSGEADSRTVTAHARSQRILTTGHALRLAMKLALSPSLALAASILAMMKSVLCIVSDDIDGNFANWRLENSAQFLVGLHATC